MIDREIQTDYDVTILGGGLAGLCLARQLGLRSDLRVLILDKRDPLPGPGQKVGESLVQVGGYYFAKVLDLEEHMLREHLMKYNLRFYWNRSDQDPRGFEDCSQAYIREFSNIPCYQLNRNVIEAELLRRNKEQHGCDVITGAADVEVELSLDGPHRVEFSVGGDRRQVRSPWVVDTTGRRRLLASRRGKKKPSPIQHGASYFWVDGLLDIERLSALPDDERRKAASRAHVGHLPLWLATNHFMGEGYWFWVIPLRGITSLGLVFDNRLISPDDVDTPEKLIPWICERYPLFARDLSGRKVLHQGSMRNISYGFDSAIDPTGWALSGEAAHFTDPLYSPGSDFIALHNTLIVDAILTDDKAELKDKCWRYDLLMHSLYESLLPTFSESYAALGDQETFVLKYTWELSVYFAFFVFPFINDLAFSRLFLLSYLAKFGKLGPVNQSLHKFLTDFYQWKKANPRPSAPCFYDFSSAESLRRAQAAFYRVGLSPQEGLRELDRQLKNLLELARYIAAYICASTLDDERALLDRRFVERLDLQNLEFAPADMQSWLDECEAPAEPYAWSFDAKGLLNLRRSETASASPVVVA